MPYVIENVVGAKEHLVDPVTIIGAMVGLRVHRPRLFETNWPLMVSKATTPEGSGRGSTGSRTAVGCGLEPTVWAPRRCWGRDRRWRTMGIDWMTWDELREAIPPAYTELVGHQLMQHVQARAAA